MQVKASMAASAIGKAGCNPAGQWLWLEHETGLPIAAAIADALTEETIR